MEILKKEGSITVHEMNLNEEPFEMLLRGEKSIEVRCNDEKRRKIKVGDVIVFHHINCYDRMVTVRVKKLYPFSTFRELYSAFDFSEFGCAGYSMEQMLSETAEIYSSEKELKYGALGIRIELLEGNNVIDAGAE